MKKQKKGKHNLSIMSKPHAYLHTIYKTAKFQKDWDKTVGGVPLTKYTFILYEMTKNERVHKLKKNIDNNVQATFTSSKFQKIGIKL